MERANEILVLLAALAVILVAEQAVVQKASAQGVYRMPSGARLSYDITISNETMEPGDSTPLPSLVVTRVRLSISAIGTDAAGSIRASCALDSVSMTVSHRRASLTSETELRGRRFDASITANGRLVPDSAFLAALAADQADVITRVAAVFPRLEPAKLAPNSSWMHDTTEPASPAAGAVTLTCDTFTVTGTRLLDRADCLEIEMRGSMTQRGLHPHGEPSADLSTSMHREAVIFYDPATASLVRASWSSMGERTVTSQRGKTRRTMVLGVSETSTVRLLR